MSSTSRTRLGAGAEVARALRAFSRSRSASASLTLRRAPPPAHTFGHSIWRARRPRGRRPSQRSPLGHLVWGSV
eukprot:122893-Prorocentrum_minimum.AAC.1